MTIRKVRSSEWVEDQTGSTLAARDYKDSGDLVVEPQSFNWQSGGDARGLDLTDEPSALSTSQTPAVLLTMRAGKPGGGKGPLLAEEQSLTLATGNGQTLFQPEATPIQDTREVEKKQGGLGVGQPGDPSFTLDTISRAGVGPVAQAFDEMNFTTDDETHHVLRAGTKQSTGVIIPQAYRKSARAQSSEDAESWVEDGQAYTLNAFDVGDTRTTHAIVEPTYSLQGSLEGRSDTAGPGGKGWKEDESFTLNTADRHSIAGPHYGVRRLTPVECERLQSFPDGWTEPAVSDSARYKAMGNAVTVNVVRWILGRLP